MERLFSKGRLEDIRFTHPELLQELNLNVSTEELLSAERAFAFADLYATLGDGNTVARLTPHAAVVRDCGRAMYAWHPLDESYRFCFNADGEDIIALASSPEHLLEICDVVLRLLAASVVRSVHLADWSSIHWTSFNGAFINAPILAYLMEQCQSLKILSMSNLEIDENHCRVLGGDSRPDLEIELKHCKITSAGARALAEILGRNQGPTKLNWCYIDNSVFADGLRGNIRLKSLKLLLSDRDVGNQDVLAIADALRENKGLVDLDLRHELTMIYETWDAVCDSLKTHPTLQVLSLRPRGWAPPPTDLKPRVQALADMMKANTSIHTIHLDRDCYSEHELYRGSVIPFLETNRFRPRVLAIQKTHLITYRAKVLRRALLDVRTDANSFWMLLSGNAEVVFPSTTATTTPAASLTAPTAAVAPSNTATVDATTTAVTVTVTRAASTTSTASAANTDLATCPTDDHKRQACP
jgi:hypothetical protein